jgi:epimerase transport system membrane fusion protein
MPGATMTMAAAARPSDSARAPTRAGWAVIALFFGVFGLWAAIAPLNAAVVGEAVVKVEGNRKSVQHLDGGTVNLIAVREGERVAAGQVLITLDSTAIGAEVEVMQQQRSQLLAIEARLSAELAESPAIVFPPELTSATDDMAALGSMEDQQQEFASRSAAIGGSEQVLRQRIAQYMAQIAGYRAQAGPLAEQLASISAERASLEELLSKGLTTRARALDLARRESAIAGEAADLAARIATAGDAIAQTEEEIAQLRKDRAAEVTGQLREVRGGLLELAPKLNAARAQLDKMVVRAPYAGRVVDLAVFSVGAVVGRGERLLDIVPDNTSLVVQARIRVEDIADIAPGMRAEVHFTSYKQRETPVIHAHVKTISADRLTDERTQVPYYVAEVAVDEGELAASPEIQLYPGMPATVMITTKERSALDYLVGPLFASFDRSFRER